MGESEKNGFETLLATVTGHVEKDPSVWESAEHVMWWAVTATTGLNPGTMLELWMDGTFTVRM